MSTIGFSSMSLELLSKAEEAGYINSQLSQLSCQLQGFLDDRVSLLYRLNDLQSRDVTLPDEILSAVFVNAHEDPDNLVSPTILTMLERAIECSNLSNLSALAFVARDNGSIPSIPPLLPTLLRSAVNLRTLIIDSCRFSCIEQIAQSPITILKLHNTPINQCLDALFLCPALKEFYCDGTRPAEKKKISSVVHSMRELHNLEIFDVELRGPGYFDESGASNSLFLHFRFPNLKHMAWGGTFAGTTERELTSFLSAMKSIITFECRSFHNERGLELIFQSLSPSVRTVYMPSLSVVQERFLRVLELITNAVVPSLQGMRSLELAFPCSHPVFTFDLSTIKEDLCEKGVHLEISEIPR